MDSYFVTLGCSSCDDYVSLSLLVTSLAMQLLLVPAENQIDEEKVKEIIRGLESNSTGSEEVQNYGRSSTDSGWESPGFLFFL